MIKKIIFLGVVLTVFISSSCTQIRCGGNKNAFLKGHEKLVIAANKAHDKGRNTDQYDKEITRMNEECYDLFKEEMNQEELQDYWSDNLEYYAWKYEDNLEQFFEEHEEELKEIAHSIEDLANVAGEKITAFFEEHEEELDDLFKTIESDLSSWAEKLKEILEDVDR